MMWWLWAACATPEVMVQGVVTEARGSEVPLEGASVSLRTWDFAVFEETTTDAEGVFRVRAPYQDLIHLVIAGDGLIPLAVPGTSGTAEVLTVPEGTLWGFPEAEEAGWREEFAGCPGVDAPGLIVGEVRVDAWIDGEYPLDPNGFAFVLDGEGERRDACYLGEDGRHDPAADRVGERGRFAIFGVEGGPWTLRVGRRLGDMSVLGTWTVYVPDGGAVSMHPALIGL